MNEKQWKQIEEQLPAGAKILRWYTAAENGQIRVIAKAPTDDYETRYNVSFDADGNASIKRF